MNYNQKAWHFSVMTQNIAITAAIGYLIKAGKRAGQCQVS